MIITFIALLYDLLLFTEVYSLFLRHSSQEYQETRVLHQVMRNKQRIYTYVCIRMYMRGDKLCVRVLQIIISQ